MKVYIDAAASALGLLAKCESEMSRGLTLLMYHRVDSHLRCATYPLQSLSIPENVFEEQVRWLANSAAVVPVQEALQIEREDQRPLVSLTFDDGYADNAEIVAPILEKYGLRGTFFVTSGFVAERRALWFDRAATAWVGLDEAARRALFARAIRPREESGRKKFKRPSISEWMQALKVLPPLERQSLVDEAVARFGQEPDSELYRPMSIPQLQQLKQAGHEIGAHSVTHPILPQLDDHELAREIGESKRQLEEWIGDRVDGFCYPNGDVDDRVERAVEQAGFSYACATSPGLNTKPIRAMRLHRISITMHRTMNRRGEADMRGFRSEISLLRERFRRGLKR